MPESRAGKLYARRKREGLARGWDAGVDSVMDDEQAKPIDTAVP